MTPRAAQREPKGYQKLTSSCPRSPKCHPKSPGRPPQAAPESQKAPKDQFSPFYWSFWQFKTVANRFQGIAEKRGRRLIVGFGIRVRPPLLKPLGSPGYCCTTYGGVRKPFRKYLRRLLTFYLRLRRTSFPSYPMHILSFKYTSADVNLAKQTFLDTINKASTDLHIFVVCCSHWARNSGAVSFQYSIQAVEDGRA